MSFMIRTKEGIRALLNMSSARNVTVLPDDIFIVSYPKSGNTWLRFLIGNLYYTDEPVTFANIEKKVPDIYQNYNRTLLRRQQPRIMKSHEYFDPRYRKVIYAVRDPRDVLISYYYHHQKFRLIQESASLEQFAQPFLTGELDPFGSWGENVGSWLGARSDSGNFLLLHYEQIHKDPKSELSKIADFLGIKASSQRLERAIEDSSADHMRALENMQSHLWKATRDTHKDIPFIRAAQPEQWREQLAAKVRKAVESAWPKQMQQLGYL